jgi:hypothetical protein
MNSTPADELSTCSTIATGACAEAQVVAMTSPETAARQRAGMSVS